MSSLSRPFFVVFEGVDCCGKTTMINELQYYCSDHEIKYIVQAEKFNEPVKSKIFETTKFPSIQLQLLYWWEARRHLMEKFYNNPNNDVLIFDRYYDSTYVYQNLKGDDIICPMNFNKYLFPTPDLTIYLKVPSDIIIERLKNVRKSTNYVDPYEKINSINNYVLRYNYLYKHETIRLKDEFHRIEIIDATQPIKVVKKQVLQLFESNYHHFLEFGESNGL